MVGPEPDDDPFFDYLLDESLGTIFLREVPFLASDVSRTDRAARSELRGLFLDEAAQRIEAALDPRSRDRFSRLGGILPRGQAVPLIGAGLSAPLGFPTWSRFLKETARDMVPEALISECLADDDLLRLAQHVLDAAGKEYFDERLSVFDDPNKQETPVHRLLPSIFKDGVFTKNFDRVLERAYDRAGSPFSLTVTASSGWDGLIAASTLGDVPLVKIHGDCRLPGTRVLSVAEYEAAYGEGSPLRRDLKQLFEARMVVFLGCSLTSDKTMEVAHAVAQGIQREGPRHYAFLPLWSDDDKAERETFLNSRRIFPIWYPVENEHHSLLGEMLWVLANAVKGR